MEILSGRTARADAPRLGSYSRARKRETHINVIPMSLTLSEKTARADAPRRGSNSRACYTDSHRKYEQEIPNRNVYDELFVIHIHHVQNLIIGHVQYAY